MREGKKLLSLSFALNPGDSFLSLLFLCNHVDNVMNYVNSNIGALTTTKLTKPMLTMVGFATTMSTATMFSASMLKIVMFT